MPPVLDPANSKVDGLAFLGLSLARKSDKGHPESETHQEAFDLNEVLDRDYEFIAATNDDGWLVGGGEAGPPVSYKLAAKDSAHVEIMRIGTYRKDWGGVPQEEIIKLMTSGEILIPQIEVLPTAVVANPDKPPELEIRFDMEPQIPDFDDELAPLPVNWQLRFLHNQLFKKCIFPSRFCPGAFHSTILRKAQFRSEEHKAQYFAKCDAAIKAWRENGPQPLNTIKRDVEGNPIAEEEPVPTPEKELELPNTIEKEEEPSKPVEVESTPEQKVEVETPAPATEEGTEKAEEPSETPAPATEEDFTEKAEEAETSETPAPAKSEDEAPMDEKAEEAATSPAKSEEEAPMDEVPLEEKVENETPAQGTEEVEVPMDEVPLEGPEKVKEKAEEETVLAGPCHSGIWLFTDRENPTHFFAPNFLPPYNTPEKRKIILDVLKEEWDEKTLSWKPCGQGSMTKKPESIIRTIKDFFVEEKKDEDSLQATKENGGDMNNFAEKFDHIVGEVLAQAHLCCSVLSANTTKIDASKAIES